jgi:hypothetical protein
MNQPDSTTKEASTTSGIINMIAFNDILVRLDAFDTVTLTSNTFGSSGIDKTLIPIFDVLSFNNLGSTVTTATGLTSGLYTTATWNLVETALALPERTNIDNQNKLAQLTAALSGLVLQASFDALEAEINFSSGLLQADFTTSTYNTFSGVFATSSGLLNTHSDTTVDNSGIVQATTDLINAMIQLEFASEATLSGLVNITTSGLDTSNYTNPATFITTRTSGIELLEQISTSGVKAFFENDFVRLNEIVSGVSNNLQTRLNELVFINFSGLQAEVNVVSGLLESNFEVDQWSAFDTARTSGLTINTNVTNSGALAFFDGVALTSGTILDITNAIETARLNLAFSGFEVLSGLVNITTSGLDSANYTAVTFDPFTTVRNSGILIVDAVRTSGALAVFEASPLSSGVITSITNELTTRFNALGFDGLEELSGLVNITTSGLIENDHTVETWSIFNAARTSGIGILDAVRTSGAVAVFDGSPITPTVINNVSSSLQAAFSGLILQTSYDALEAEINFSSGLEEADFVNFETFSGAFAFGSGLLNTQANTDVTNSGILDATSGLINAMLQLEFSGQEALSGLLNITSGLDTSNFIDPDLYITTRSSGLELLDLISTSGVKAFYEEAFVRSNTVVSGLTTDLETQLSGLVFINFSGLLTEVNLVSGLVESNFEADEWPAFAQALNSGLTINTNVTNSGALAFFEGVTSGLILDVTTALNTARGALVFTNFAGLQAEVNLVSGLVASNFTPDTWNPFNSALTSGLTINTNVTNSGALAIFNEIPLTSGVIFDITTSLQETRSNLVYQGFVELSGLVNGDTSGLVASNFTENTWTAFNNARTSGLDVLSAIESSGAVAVFEGVTLTSGTITTITATLQDAYDALDFIGYAELSGLVQLVEPLDASNFTDPAAFEAARTSGVLITTAVEASGAIAIFDDVRLTSGVITTVFNALNDTTSGLVFHNFDTLSGLINVTTSGIDLSNFTQEAVDAFTIARTSGLNLYNNIVASGVFATEEGTLVTSGLIDTINISMQHAYGVLGQSFLGFDVLINEVNISSGLEESNFKDPNIPASWTTFTISLQDAENLIQAINGSGVIAVDPKQTSEVVTSGLIDQIINSLVTARTNLVFNEYPELVTLVDVTTSGLDLSNFEETTAFETAQASGLAIIQVVTDSGALAMFEGVPLTSGAIRVVIDALETAYSGLVYFNYNDLVSTLELYSGLNELDFTPETWSTFDVARTSGLSIVSEVTNSGVRAEFDGNLLTSGVIKDIRDANDNAGSGLVFSGIEQLINVINVTSGIEADSGLYTIQSYTAFEQAYNSGVSILSAITTSGALGEFDSTRITSALIVATADSIQSTSGLLILDELYQAYVVIYNVNETVDEDDFTIESYAVYSGILAGGVSDFSITYQDVFNAPQSNVDVINATTALNSGLITLRLSGLETLSGLVNVTTSGLEAEDFTIASWNALQAERTSGTIIIDQITTSGALGLFEGSFITSGVLNASISSLNDNYEALVFSGLAGLQTVIDETSSIIESSGLYETNSYLAFEEAYNSGLAILSASGILDVFEGEVLTNAKVVEITNAINVARDNLISLIITTTSQIDDINSTQFYIDSTSGLIALRDYVNQGSGTNDLTFTMISDVSLSGLNWIPIGHGGATPPQFQGTFNGSGFAIQDLYASGIAGGYQGLFGHVGTTGFINNVVIESGIISGAGVNVGLLVGLNQGTVQNATVLGNVIVNNTEINAGGFIGRNEGTITNILYDVDSLSMTNAQEFTGGFVGYNTSGISNVVFKTSQSFISSTQKSVGGFIGSNHVGGVINNIYLDQASSRLEALNTDGYIGGFAGRNNATISNVSMIVQNHLSVNSNYSGEYAGGFVGYIENTSEMKNILFVAESGLNMMGIANGYFMGGTRSITSNITLSGVFISIDLSRASRENTAFNGFIIGAVNENSTLTLNNVYYTSGLNSADSYILIGTRTQSGNTFDQVASSGSLSGVDSGFILNVINADDVFTASVDNYPVFKDIGVITIENQRQIAIPWRP